MDEDNGDVDNIPSDGEGLDGNDETSDESEADSDVSLSVMPSEQKPVASFGTTYSYPTASYPPSLEEIRCVSDRLRKLVSRLSRVQGVER